ncbi:MAG: hypothetical protein AVDCRST_MAG70-908 [uncultured Thermomicrobiales bacterium]|uniref:Uncharacterized protein n=1 Tax=uncultured Thermomicrobiales bacterium TaxID=1645740 RepID=A0A6J4UKW7_9BACT|nr:MAG: hypothetical protein AVDCRST_MAG70-908 [uncultured Thermomicrobiales bacterium]
MEGAEATGLLQVIGVLPLGGAGHGGGQGRDGAQLQTQVGNLLLAHQVEQHRGGPESDRHRDDGRVERMTEPDSIERITDGTRPILAEERVVGLVKCLGQGVDARGRLDDAIRQLLGGHGSSSHADDGNVILDLSQGPCRSRTRRPHRSALVSRGPLGPKPKAQENPPCREGTPRHGPLPTTMYASPAVPSSGNSGRGRVITSPSLGSA